MPLLRSFYGLFPLLVTWGHRAWLQGAQSLYGEKNKHRVIIQSDAHCGRSWHRVTWKHRRGGLTQIRWVRKGFPDKVIPDLRLKVWVRKDILNMGCKRWNRNVLCFQSHSPVWETNSKKANENTTCDEMLWEHQESSFWVRWGASRKGSKRRRSLSQTLRIGNCIGVCLVFFRFPPLLHPASDGTVGVGTILFFVNHPSSSTCDQRNT